MTESCRLITEEQYKEWKASEKKLEIATQALKVFKKNEDYYLDYGIDINGNKAWLYPNRVATKALKEMEEVDDER